LLSRPTGRSWWGKGNSEGGDGGVDEAFRWTAGGGMVGLGDLPGGGFSSGAFDVSADGSVVVGTGRSDAGDEAFVWDAGNGIQNLQTLLTDAGLDLTGWGLFSARAVSDDGLVIVGAGINPDGVLEAWVADLSISIEQQPELTGLGLRDVGSETFLTRSDVTGDPVMGVTLFPVGGVFANNNNAVPEPITAALGLMGLGVLGLATRRRVA